MVNDEIYLTPDEVSKRIRASKATLGRWRMIGTGPRWVRMGPRKVLYPLADLLWWEKVGKRE